MMRRFFSFVVAAVFALTMPLLSHAQSSATIPEPVRAAFDRYLAEAKARCAEPKLQPYFSKTACNGLDETLEQLSDSSKITEAEKPALQRNHSEYHEESRRFAQALRQFGGQKWNDLATLREKLDSEMDEYVLNLYSGKITWGEFNRRRKEISVQARDRVHDILNSK